MTTKKKTEVTYLAPELEDANDETITADEPETVDDTVELFEDEAEPEPAPEPEQSPEAAAFDARTLAHEERYLADVEAQIADETCEYERLTLERVTATPERRREIDERRAVIERTHKVLLVTDIPNARARIEVLKAIEQEAELERREQGIEKLRKELATARDEARSVRGPREQKVAAFRIKAIEDEIAQETARLQIDAGNLPWWGSVKLNAGERKLNERLSKLRRNLANHEADKEDADEGGRKQDADQLNYRIAECTRGIEQCEAELAKIHERRNEAPKRPRLSDPSTWPVAIVNRVHAQSEHFYQEARKSFDRSNPVGFGR